MKQEALLKLKKEIEHSFGRKIISYRDCVQLVDDILQKTGFTVNVNTLRRFFGLVRTDYTASPSTLTILSKYCGFNSVDEIENISLGSNSDTTLNKEEVFHYLVSLFRHLPVSEKYIPIAGTIVEQTIIFLERNPDLTDRFQREIARLPAGQYYYYEIAVNMDQLNAYYGTGLQYYIRSKPEEEAMIFANAVQVLRCWLSSDHAGLEKHYEPLRHLRINRTIPSHITVRLMAAQLFYANAKGRSTDEIIAEIIKYYAQFSEKSKENPFYFPYFEFILCEALTLTNQPIEAAEFLQLAKSFLAKSLKGAPPPAPFTIWDDLSDFYDISNPLPDLQQSQANASPSHSRFNKKFGTLITFFLTNKRKAKPITLLVKETGFLKFNTLLKE